MKYSRADLLRALEKDEIVPFFQPLIEMQSGRIVGFEALARWQHPRDGMVVPKDFIPLTEASGLSRDLTFSMLRQVVAIGKRLPDHLHYSVNVSPLQLRDTSLPQTIAAAVRAGDPSGTFPLKRLTIEITESAFVHNLGQAANIAAEIKALGLRLALDDFGTGYSSLLHLQSLPFDVIKVDQSFVRHMVSQRGSRKIVSAVLGLGLSLGLTTVAEGVEDENQERILRWLGCDVGQGWRFGHPMPAAALSEFLDDAPHTSAPDPPPEPTSNGPHPGSSHSASLNLADLQSGLSCAPVGLCLLDRTMRLISVNPPLAKMLPSRTEAILGRSIDEVLPQAAFLLRPYILRALKGDPVSGIEIPLHSPGIPHETSIGFVSLQPVRDEANEVVGVAASVTDVTRRKQLHDALRQSNSFLHAIWNTAPLGIVTAMGAANAVTLSGNPGAELILRHPIVPASQDPERKAWRIFDKQAQPIAWLDSPLMRAIEHGRPTPPENLLYLRGDDTLTTLQVTASPIFTAAGKVLGAVMTLIDLENGPDKLHDASLAAGLAINLWTSRSGAASPDPEPSHTSNLNFSDPPLPH